MKNTSFWLFLNILLFSATSCSHSHFVKPLQEKEHAVAAGLGGPLIEFSGAVIPIPNLTGTYGYGFKENFTGFGGINLTALAYGSLLTEFGVVRSFGRSDGLKPAFSIAPAFTAGVDFYEFRPKIWPRLEANAYWNYRDTSLGNYAYIGINNWFELADKRAFNEPQPHNWLLTLQAGHVFENPKTNYIIELKYNAVNASNEDLAVDYAAKFGSAGALGVYFGVVRKF